eukprot:gene10571-12228_t
MTVSFSPAPLDTAPDGPDNKRPQKWTESEVQCLQSAISGQSRIIDWAQVALSVPGRTGKQCREKYRNDLNPSLSKEPWSAQEEYILARVHSTTGNQWSSIAKYLPGRSENNIKNHWNSTARSFTTMRSSRKRSLLWTYCRLVHQQVGMTSAELFDEAKACFSLEQGSHVLEQMTVPDSYFDSQSCNNKTQLGADRLAPHPGYLPHAEGPHHSELGGRPPLGTPQDGGDCEQLTPASLQQLTLQQQVDAVRKVVINGFDSLASRPTSQAGSKRTSRDSVVYATTSTPPLGYTGSKRSSRDSVVYATTSTPPLGYTGSKRTSRDSIVCATTGTPPPEYIGSKRASRDDLGLESGYGGPQPASKRASRDDLGFEPGYMGPNPFSRRTSREHAEHVVHCNSGGFPAEYAPHPPTHSLLTPSQPAAPINTHNLLQHCVRQDVEFSSWDNQSMGSKDYGVGRHTIDSYPSGLAADGRGNRDDFAGRHTVDNYTEGPVPARHNTVGSYTEGPVPPRHNMVDNYTEGPVPARHNTVGSYTEGPVPARHNTVDNYKDGPVPAMHNPRSTGMRRHTTGQYTGGLLALKPATKDEAGPCQPVFADMLLPHSNHHTGGLLAPKHGSTDDLGVGPKQMMMWDVAPKHGSTDDLAVGPKQMMMWDVAPKHGSTDNLGVGPEQSMWDVAPKRDFTNDLGFSCRATQSLDSYPGVLVGSDRTSGDDGVGRHSIYNCSRGLAALGHSSRDALAGRHTVDNYTGSPVPARRKTEDKYSEGPVPSRHNTEDNYTGGPVPARHNMVDSYTGPPAAARHNPRSKMRGRHTTDHYTGGLLAPKPATRDEAGPCQPVISGNYPPLPTGPTRVHRDYAGVDTLGSHANLPHSKPVSRDNLGVSDVMSKSRDQSRTNKAPQLSPRHMEAMAPFNKLPSDSYDQHVQLCPTATFPAAQAATSPQQHRQLSDSHVQHVQLCPTATPPQQHRQLSDSYAQHVQLCPTATSPQQHRQLRPDSYAPPSSAFLAQSTYGGVQRGESSSEGDRALQHELQLQFTDPVLDTAFDYDVTPDAWSMPMEDLVTLQHEMYRGVSILQPHSGLPIPDYPTLDQGTPQGGGQEDIFATDTMLRELASVDMASTSADSLDPMFVQYPQGVAGGQGPPEASHPSVPISGWQAGRQYKDKDKKYIAWVPCESPHAPPKLAQDSRGVTGGQGPPSANVAEPRPLTAQQSLGPGGLPQLFGEWGQGTASLAPPMYAQAGMSGTSHQPGADSGRLGGAFAR